jgi:hypothetical protein
VREPIGPGAGAENLGMKRILAAAQAAGAVFCETGNSDVRYQMK